MLLRSQVSTKNDTTVNTKCSVTKKVYDNLIKKHIIISKEPKVQSKTYLNNISLTTEILVGRKFINEYQNILKKLGLNYKNAVLNNSNIRNPI